MNTTPSRIKWALPAPSGSGKILFVGDTPGEEDMKMGAPFVGASGQELTRMLRDAGLKRTDCYLTNVFMERPHENNLAHFCGSKAEVSAKLPGYAYPSLAAGQYVHPDRLYELARLAKEIETANPNLIIALGNTALWALCGITGIKKLRGAVRESTLCPGKKVLPTFHPSQILRSYGDRVIVIADLLKAKRECEFPDIRRLRRTIYVPETVDETVTLLRGLGPRVAPDIETGGGGAVGLGITVVGFADGAERAVVIPFVDPSRPTEPYWKTEEEEIAVWKEVKAVFEGPREKIFQNGAYDVQWLWKLMGIACHNWVMDTMLAHHALFLELPKGLDFLGSIYTDEAAWKGLRRAAKIQTAKKEE